MSQSLFTDAAPFYDGEAVAWEPNRDYSRDNGTVATAAGIVPTCTVVGIITSSGKYVPIAPGASDGSQTTAGVLVNRIDASAGDVTNAVIWKRQVVLNQSRLNYNGASGGQITTINAALLAMGIKVIAGA